MSFDTLVSLALFVGALFLMMRFGCGAHMGTPTTTTDPPQIGPAAQRSGRTPARPSAQASRP